MAPETTPLDYESQRQRTIEENRKRLHELGLDAIPLFGPKKPSLAARKHSSSNNDSLTPGCHIEKRRSTRLASSPRVDYAEARRPTRSSFREEASQRPRSGLRSQGLQLRRSKATRKPVQRGKYSVAEMKAEEALRTAGGDRDCPFFIKGMLKSHTSGGFWLGLPSDFCTEYFHKDDYVILEDEGCKQWECRYLHNKHGLSGGWRGFSLDHHLRDGDALLFQLVSTRIFKVQISRARGSAEPVSERYALAVRQEYQSMAKGRSEGVQRPRKRMSPVVKADSGDDVKPRPRKMLKNLERDIHAHVMSSRLNLQDAVKLEIATDFPEVKSETSEVYVSPTQRRQHFSYCRLASLPKAISIGDFARPPRSRKFSIPLSSQKHYLVRSEDGKPLRVK